MIGLESLSQSSHPFRSLSRPTLYPPVTTNVYLYEYLPLSLVCCPVIMSSALPPIRYCYTVTYLPVFTVPSISLVCRHSTRVRRFVLIDWTLNVFIASRAFMMVIINRQIASGLHWHAWKRWVGGYAKIKQENWCWVVSANTLL